MTDIETLKKMTGWDDSKLASFIMERANEGMSEDQIISAIANQKSSELGLDKIKPEVKSEYSIPTVGEMIADGSIKKETKKKEDEPSMLQRLGLWFKENANADEDRNKKARESIAKSWNDYRDSTDPMFRVGLVNAIFGDNSGLNAYYQMQNSNAEAQKNRDFQAEQARLNREAQASYNSTFKAIEEANAKREELNGAKKDLANLLQKENRSVADDLMIEDILEKYPELKNGDIYGRVKKAEEAAAKKKAEEEALAKQKANDEFAASVKAEQYLATVPSTFKNDKLKTNWIAQNQGLIGELPMEYQKQVWQKIGGKSQKQIDEEKRHDAGVSFGISQGQKDVEERKNAQSRYNELLNKKFRTAQETTEMNNLKTKYKF